MDKTLHLMGLAFRAGKVAAGEEPAAAVSRARDARLLLTACDAADNTLRRAQHFAQTGQCLLLQVPYTREELGQVTGRKVCALLAITELGLARAIVEKLAQDDPLRYAAAQEKMELKWQRAAQRRALHNAPAPQQEDPPAKHTPEVSRLRKPPQSPRRQDSRGNMSGNGQGRRRSTRDGAREPKRGPERPVPQRFLHSRPVKKGKGSGKKTAAQG